MKLQLPKSKNRQATLFEWCQAAIQLHKQGRLNEAEIYYDAILKTQPNHFDALQFMGRLCLEQERHEEAVKLLRRALAVEPRRDTVHGLLGDALAACGRYPEAIASFDLAIKLQPRNIAALHNRGSALLKMGRTADALASFDQAIGVEPTFAEALISRGNVLLEIDRADDAIASYNAAIALNPSLAVAHVNCGAAYRAKGQLEQALASYDAAVAVAPDLISAHYNRGNVLSDLMQFEEALASFDRVLSWRPDHVQALINRGIALRDLGRSSDALAAFDAALTLQPENRYSAYNRSLVLLSTGQFEPGWLGYEARFHQAEFSGVPDFAAPYPAWTGQPLQGRHILVYDEQGHGDVLQFARYLPLLVSQGARVTAAVRPNLHRLLRSLQAPIAFLDRDTMAGSGHYDFQSAMLSLPIGFHTTLDTIPAAGPYLSAEPALVADLRARLPRSGFSIGIAWHGNTVVASDAGRSLPLSAFAAIAAVEGVNLISLQKGAGQEQIDCCKDILTMDALGNHIDNGSDAFVDTAAVMASLDLIITCDTSIAHLAGALGRPIWIALKAAPDWRWLQERSDSPWYPSMRLYRQHEARDWADVFDRMAMDLRALLGG